MKEEKLQDVAEEISRTLFANFAIVLYVSDVGVLRPEKFQQQLSSKHKFGISFDVFVTFVIN